MFTVFPKHQRLLQTQETKEVTTLAAIPVGQVDIGTQANYLSSPTDHDIENKFSFLLTIADLQQKNSELNKLLWTLTNQYEFYYMIEKFGKQLTPTNLCNYFIAFTKYSKNCKNTNDPNQIKIPKYIVQIFNERILRQSIHMEDFECQRVFKCLYGLGFGLDNCGVQALMQLLKYHVNTLGINDLCTVKTYLEYYKTRDHTNNEFTRNLKTTLDMALKFSFELKQNELGTLIEQRHCIDILTHYAKELSETSFQQILYKLHMKKMNSFGFVNLAEALAKRKYRHTGRLNYICKFITTDVYNFHYNFELAAQNTDSQIGSTFRRNFYSFRFFNALRSLNYYDQTAIDALLKDILSTFNDPKYIELGLNLTQDHQEMMKAILNGIITFRHKNIDFIEYFMDNNCDANNMHRTNSCDLLYYASLCKYDKLSPEFITNCVDELMKSNDAKNPIIIRTLKALLMHNQHNIANDLSKRVVLQDLRQNSDKMFLKDIFKFDLNIEYNEFDKTRSENLFWKMIEQFSAVNKRWTFKKIQSYVCDGTIVDTETKQVCAIMLIFEKDYFRNESELTGEIDLKKNYIKNTDGIKHLLVLNLRNILNTYLKPTDEQHENTVFPYIENEIKLAFTDSQK